MILALALVLAAVVYVGVIVNADRRRLRRELRRLDDCLENLIESGWTSEAARRFLEDRYIRSLAVWAILGAIAWLDHGRQIHATHAAVFAFIVPVIGAIADFFSVVGAAVETALSAVVAALAASVSWLLATLGTFISATGSVFSKVWDGLKVVWNDALKPALRWFDDAIGKVKDWLKATFGPVFDFLKNVRDTLTNIYKRFLKPILSLIDFVHQLDGLLQVFHINVLQGLDNTLEALERRLEEPILWLNSKINDILNVLTTVITADGFFQRYTFLRTAAKNVETQFAILVNAGATPQSGDQLYKGTRALETPDIPTATAAAVAWLNGEPSDDAESLDAAVQAFAVVVSADGAIAA